MIDAHSITPETTVMRHQKVLHSDMGDAAVMMSVERGAYYSLDPIGTQIWKSLETPMLVSTLCAQLLTQYDVTPEQCAANVLRFLNELYAYDLIAIVEPAPQPTG